MFGNKQRNKTTTNNAHKQWQGLYGYLAFNPASSFGAV